MLTERAEVLTNVRVNGYLQTVALVASDESTWSLQQKLRSPSVRNTMVRPSEAGYRLQPYVSSAGISPNQRRRHYVEPLQETTDISFKVREGFGRELAQTEPDMGVYWNRPAATCVIGFNRMEYVTIIGGVRHFSAPMSLMLLFIQGSSAE